LTLFLKLTCRWGIGTGYAVRKAVNARHLLKEVNAAQILEENGHTVFFTSENKTKRMKNYDAIVDWRLGDFKKPESFDKIRKEV